MRFQNGRNKVAIELQVVQFWSEIILVISNQTRAARSFDFEITRMISDQIALHSVQLPLLNKLFLCSRVTKQALIITYSIKYIVFTVLHLLCENKGEPIERVPGIKLLYNCEVSHDVKA